MHSLSQWTMHRSPAAVCMLAVCTLAVIFMDVLCMAMPRAAMEVMTTTLGV